MAFFDSNSIANMDIYYENLHSKVNKLEKEIERYKGDLEIREKQLEYFRQASRDYQKAFKDAEEENEQLRKNIISLDMSMMDAPYFGFNGDNIKGVRFAIDKIIKGTGITIDDLIKEMNEKKWF